MDVALQKSWGEGMDESSKCIPSKYKEVIGGYDCEKAMPLLTGELHSLLSLSDFS